ncbi:Molybdopterin synthase catalytic subunit [Apiospora saccharicola]|uniref:Molybdopterin synthase catalytic subunit n=1 Tax=Apiospora saccharicola TaxID=335842 RepID=A0ABR1VLT9_9PEZI
MDPQATEVQEEGCYAGLTHDHLNAQGIMDHVRSPQAGAIVLFAGTTRDNFGGKPVKELQYSAYNPLALRTMMSICKEIREKHDLKLIAMVHRLGTVPIGEESILIAVSSAHRQAAWRAGEEALEECKSRVEVWKLEEFGGEEGGVWRANRDGLQGVQVPASAPTNPQDSGDGPFGPVIRPRRPGEMGHGAVVHPKPDQLG